MSSMAIPDLDEGASITVGLKQTRLAVEKGGAVKVFVAMDAEPRLILPLVDCCRQRCIPLVEVASMRELGSACGIQVGAAAAALLKQ